MVKSMNTNVVCPDCGSPLQIVIDGAIGVDWFNTQTGRSETRIEPRPFAACSGCEFCLDLTVAVHELKRTA